MKPSSPPRQPERKREEGAKQLTHNENLAMYNPSYYFAKRRENQIKVKSCARAPQVHQSREIEHHQTPKKPNGSPGIVSSSVNQNLRTLPAQHVQSSQRANPVHTTRPPQPSQNKIPSLYKRQPPDNPSNFSPESLEECQRAKEPQKRLKGDGEAANRCGEALKARNEQS